MTRCDVTIGTMAATCFRTFRIIRFHFASVRMEQNICMTDGQTVVPGVPKCDHSKMVFSFFVMSLFMFQCKVVK